MQQQKKSLENLNSKDKKSTIVVDSTIVVCLSANRNLAISMTYAVNLDWLILI